MDYVYSSLTMPNQDEPSPTTVDQDGPSSSKPNHAHPSLIKPDQDETISSNKCLQDEQELIDWLFDNE